MQDRSDLDVVVVGASVAGCAAATLLARAGRRVALVDRRTDPAAYKRVCGHFIQSSAVPVLERLGVLEELERCGGVRGHGRVWTRYGWTAHEQLDPALPRSLSIRREILDPLLRRTAAATPGVELLLGCELQRLDRTGEVTVAGLARRGGEPLELTARLVVGADGRGSRTAQLAGLETRKTDNGRFAYWAYFAGPRLGTDASVHLWILEPDVAIATPTDGGLMLCAAFPEVAHRERYRADPEAAIRELFARLPDGPCLDGAPRVGPIVGRLDLTNETRPRTGPGLALVGDAALAADPVTAVGCGWALQSASWLADAVTPALRGEEPLGRGLRRYARRHRRALAGHARLVDRSSRERAMNPPQRLLFAAATRDGRTAERIEAFASRRAGPSRLLAPHALARAAAVQLRPRR